MSKFIQIRIFKLFEKQMAVLKFVYLRVMFTSTPKGKGINRL
jgi:hypothetical protein